MTNFRSTSSTTSTTSTPKISISSTTARTFRAEGKTFKTTSRKCYALVIRRSGFNYFNTFRKDYDFIERPSTTVYFRTDDAAKASEELAKVSLDAGFVSASIVDTFTGHIVQAEPASEAEPVITAEVVTLTVTKDQFTKITQALHTHIDAAVKAVRKARKSGDALAERLLFSDLTVAIDTLRTVDSGVGDHFTAEWLIGGAR